MEKYRKSAVLLLLAVLTAGCSDRDGSETPEVPVVPRIKYEILKEYSFDDLKGLESDFKKENIGGAFDFLSLIDRSVRYDGDVQIRVYKVSVASEHPGRPGTEINLSGLLIAPPPEEGRAYRQAVAPPYTYVLQREAPTVRMARSDPDPHILFWLIETFNHGLAVMIPDYPGFGDSFGQCYIPYVEKESMVRTSLEYLKAARTVLGMEKYAEKSGLVISGYSLGAYVSLQLARELETGDSCGEMSVDLLFTGGSPCNLLREADLIRASASMPQPYLFPLALLGYRENGYPQLVMSDCLKEPYASEAAAYLDGQHEDYSRFFTDRPTDLFTADFLENRNQEELNKILEENSVKPWKNHCRFIMTHGESDETVYYGQAEQYASEHEKYGGSVSFRKTSGTHTGAGLWFFWNLYAELEKSGL
ncbi:MAG: alpha/beta hydrolase [Tannerella sp.]|jgi:pimeloyl-ACP methyl ester carboxylesterase|nr:alpha/beta hydrolase [Tannerella sp.]